MSTHNVPGQGPPVFEGPSIVQDMPSPPSITIQGVPAAVTREQVCESIRALGLDPCEVTALSFKHSAVHVEVYSNQEPTSSPTQRWTYNGKRAATHRLTIPIVDGSSKPVSDS